jgi:hypothetical protein
MVLARPSSLEQAVAVEGRHAQCCPHPLVLTVEEISSPWIQNVVLRGLGVEYVAGTQSRRPSFLYARQSVTHSNDTDTILVDRPEPLGATKAAI